MTRYLALTFAAAVAATLACCVRSHVILPYDDDSNGNFGDETRSKRTIADSVAQYSRPIRRTHELFGKRSDRGFGQMADELFDQLEEGQGAVAFADDEALQRKRKRRARELFGKRSADGALGFGGDATDENLIDSLSEAQLNEIVALLRQSATKSRGQSRERRARSGELFG